MGKRKAALIGGVQDTNLRAIHFYEEFGFQKAGWFSTKVGNYDMALDL